MGDLALCAELLARGAPASERDVEIGESALHAAAGGSGSAAVVALLLDAGAAVDDATKNGKVPLHAAAGEGYVEAAALLLARGAAIEARNSAGWSALHWAVRLRGATSARARAVCGTASL